MVIRKAESANIDEIMQIILDARASIGRLGIDQWQYGYPTRDIVIEDIELGRSYVVEDGEVLGTFALIDDGEPTYDKIYRGEWLTEGNNYVAFHRIALAGKARGTGLASKIIEFIAGYAKENGFDSIRVDTHKGNIPMRKMLEKNGFSHCGTIHLADGQHRVAYEKVL